MKSTISKSVKFVLLGLLIAGVIAFCFRPVRAVVCENTNICVYSCEEYSGKPIDINAYPQEPITFVCEKMEAIRNRELKEAILKILHLNKFKPCPPPLHFTTREECKTVNNPKKVP